MSQTNYQKASSENYLYTERLSQLRQKIKAQNLNAFLVPKVDEHRGEYVPPNAERLRWLTGFSGSAGLSIVLQHHAAIFVDGRYTLQAQKQVNSEIIEICSINDLHSWLKNHIQPGQRIGFDPWLHTHISLERFRKEMGEIEVEWIPCPKNPIDTLWENQPIPPQSNLKIHDLQFSGKPTHEKLQQIASALTKQGAEACILTLPPSIAWLFNIRSNDMPYLPAPLAFAIVQVNGKAELFLNPSHQSPQVVQHLGNDVSLYSKQELATRLHAISKDINNFLVDKATCPWFITNLLQGANKQVIFSQDPCILPQACKNSTEVSGAKKAHIRDGAALVNFLAWLSQIVPKKPITEFEAAQKLLEFRQKQKYFEEPSFPTISCAGPNGAMIHYFPTSDSSRIIQPDELYLVDSGGQYLDGTTDVTRVMTFATPNTEQRDRFTRVLKGHIALAQARFPEGTTGQQLDVLARYWLWQAGLDFEHGTGHGVGSYLGVHEGPQYIGKARSGSIQAPLQVGMLLSNEPGYYKSGAYGIRIESILVVKELVNETYEYPILGFETITMAPINRDLIDSELLSATDINWINRYHTQVRKTLMPLVDKDAAIWLQKETEEIN